MTKKELEDRLKDAESVISTIAALHRTKKADLDYWIKLDNVAGAELLVQDTMLARDYINRYNESV